MSKGKRTELMVIQGGAKPDDDGMREVLTHRVPEETTEIRVFATGAPGKGGANEEYLVFTIEQDGPELRGVCQFQRGPVREVGPNGITNEALLAIVLDRLETFQAGPFPCKENEMAQGLIHNALYHLKTRTKGRIQRGVEGKMEE